MTKRNILIDVILVAALALSAFLFFQAYSAYAKMKKFQGSALNVHTLERVGDLRDAAGIELLDSVRYYGVKGVNYADELSQSRERVDAHSETLRHWIDQHHPSVVNQTMLKEFDTQVRTLRLKVDALDPDYEEKFGSQDRHDPIAILLEGMHLEEKIGGQDTIRAKLADYLQILDETKRLVDERAMLSYFVARRTELTPENVVALERVFEGAGDTTRAIAKQIDLLRNSEQLEHLLLAEEALFDVRADVFEHAKSADFTTTLFEIEKKFHDVISIASTSEKKMLTTIGQSLERGSEQNKTLLVQYTVLGAILLFVALVFFRIYQARLREKRAIEESLSEISSELDEDKREELHQIMERGDRVAIYRFLARTTMDARSAEERALSAEKVKDIFLANMSHEIRTPLNGILGFAQLMQDTPLNPEQEEFMGVIGSSSRNLLKIVNDILDLSKIRANKIELESIPFSIVENMEQAIEPHSARALEEEIEYSAFIDPSLPAVMGDPTKLTQIMTNLIGNAVKFTNKGGTVDIDVRKIKESDEEVVVRFSIKDSGVGISPEKKKKIFEPFSQADVSTTREFGGTGLGLTITRDIVAYMGSTLELISELGKGSEFFFEMQFRRTGEMDDVQSRLDGIHFAYYHSGESTLRQMERNLALYVRASGGRFRMVGDHELDLMEDVDVFLLDYSDKKTREKIDTLIRLGKKTILISTVAQKHAEDEQFDQVDRVMYRPLTASKLIRAYASLDGVQADKLDAKRVEDNTALEGLKILVAEDNPINQKLIKRVLEGMGIVPTLVSNGKEALDLRLAGEFSAILMDIQMPVMGGIEATKQIIMYEYEKGQRHVPIIALTANALQGDRERYIGDGFDDYVSKPLNIDQLRQVLRLHCQQPEENILRESHDDVPMEKSVVMYSRSSGLAQRLHHDALLHAGYTFDVVQNESDVYERLRENPPAYILMDTRTIELKDCTLISTIDKSRVRQLFFFGRLNPLLGCQTGAHREYTSISSLLKMMKQ